MFSKNKVLILGPVILLLLVFINFNTSNDLRGTTTSQDALRESGNMSKNVAAAKVGVEESEEYGSYLTDGNGRTLYVFLADSKNQSSSCYNRCAEVWPPLTTTGNPKAAASAVSADMLGTIERRDGTMQVTYNGWPLYYYAKDQGQGELIGQDVKGFGAEWYLIAPDGNYIHD